MISLKNKLKIRSWGLYSHWDKDSKQLPKVTKFTLDIPIGPGQEWGMIIDITGAKGELLEWEMIHPPMKDDNGQALSQFRGTYKVPTNVDQFFLGDTFWEPYEQMAGEWVLRIKQNKSILVEKKFQAHLPKF